MIKLERIYVQNYKNIAEADLPLGNMNVIVGENNSGKSNLLSVIPLLNYIINGPVKEVKIGLNMGGLFSLFGVILNKESTVESKERLAVKIEFYNPETNIIYLYEVIFGVFFTNKRVYSKVTLHYPTIELRILNELYSYKSKTQTGKAITIFKRVNNEVTYGNGIKKTDTIISNLDEYTSVIRLLNLIKSSDNITTEYNIALEALESIFNSNIYYLSSQMLLNHDMDLYSKKRIESFNLSKEIELLKQSGEWTSYERALNEILQIKGVEIIEAYRVIGSDYVIKIAQNNSLKSIHELSDGSLVLLALITKIFSDSSDIFFIEEPENSIHPRALYELMKLIREKSLDKQFIITTHSPYLLNMIKPEEVLVAEIQEDGLSKIGKLPNVKAIKKKLAKSFMSFGDIVFAGPENEDDSE